MLLLQLLRPLGQQSSPHPPVATVGHHREFQVQGGVDREPPMTIQPPPSGESVARGSVLGEQVQVSPCRPEFSAPLQVLLSDRSLLTLPRLL